MKTDPKPDNTSEQKDGGYFFPAWNIHVVAKSEKEAKQKIKDFYEIDVNKQVPPPKSSNTEE